MYANSPETSDDICSKETSIPYPYIRPGLSEDRGGQNEVTPAEELKTPQDEGRMTLGSTPGIPEHTVLSQLRRTGCVKVANAS